MTVRLLHGDCREVLATLGPDSVDAVIADPPYGLGFMGREWDTFSPTAVRQRESQLARKGPYRASEAWPSKRGNPRTRGGGPAVSYNESPSGNRAFQSWCGEWAAECLRVLKPGGHLLAFGGPRTEHRLVCGIEDAGFQIRDKLLWLFGSGYPKSKNLCRCQPPESAGEDAFGWPVCGACLGRIGLGTALKPAWEPIVMARKPLAGTVLRNVEQWGTGAIDIDGCRLATNDELYVRNSSGDRGHAGNHPAGTPGFLERVNGGSASSIGRWPPNVALDEAAAAALDDAVGTLRSGANPTRRGSNKHASTYGMFAGQVECVPARGADAGGPSRFFYCPKPSQRERNAGLDGLAKRKPHPPEPNGRAWDIPGSRSQARANHHPTVKPIELCRWLVRMVTPPAGTVLDPFAGSGTTGIACVLEGRSFVGIEREVEYLAIAEKRIAHWRGPLFADVEAGAS